MGLMHVAVAGALGATIYASDFIDTRKRCTAAARSVSAYAPQDALDRLRAATEERLCDAVICGPGTPGALAAAEGATGADGTVLMITPLEAKRALFVRSKLPYSHDIRLVASYSAFEQLRFTRTSVGELSRNRTAELAAGRLLAALASGFFDRHVRSRRLA